MSAAAKAIALILVTACSGARPRPAGGAGAPITAAIYRDGDPRIAPRARAIHRPGGDAVTLEARALRPPAAMVVIRRAVDLRAGRGSIALPEIPGDAGPIWLRARGGPGALEVERIDRPASIAEPRALRGRRVIARVGGERIEGTLVDADAGGALIERGGELVVVPAQVLELADPIAEAQPIRAAVRAARSGRYPLEVAYRTGTLGWSLDLHIEVAAAEATVTPIVAIDNRGPALGGARVELFEGLHDDPRRPARSIWRGRIDVAAGETRRALPARSVAAAVELRYRGFVGDRPEDRRRPGWGTASTEIVEQVLRLPPGSLPPAAAIAHIEIAGDGPARRHRVRIAEAAEPGAPIDLVLGAAGALRGTRRRLWIETSAGGAAITEAYELAVINRSERPVTVRVSEPLARSEEVELVEAPAPARLIAGNLEIELAIGARGREAIRYVARYQMRP